MQPVPFVLFVFLLLTRAIYSCPFVHGNTITLECTFKDKDGNINDPDTVKVILYDYKHVQQAVFTGSDITKLSTGIYEYAYTPSDSVSRSFVYYEWNGVRSGKVSLLRDEIKTEFIGV